MRSLFLFVLCSPGCVLLSGFLVERCGNGIVEGDEACDDGGSVDGDGCSADCLRDPVCGDGFTDVDEGCDDGNVTNEDGCSSLCLSEFCGDGVVQAGLGEACDEGALNGAGVCLSDCTLNASCVGGDANISDPQSGHCYQRFNQARAWTEAQADCAARGGHLASISSKAESDLLAPLITDNVWIGLNDLTTEDAFVWESLERPVFVNFDLAEPNNTAGSEDCVLIKKNGRWNDASCVDPFSYLCEFETPVCGNGIIEAGEECDDADPTIDICKNNCQIDCAVPPGLFGFASLDAATGSCYMIGGDAEASWPSAQASCVAFHGHLASIHTTRENTQVRNLVAQNNLAWIGLNDRINEAEGDATLFVWESGEPVGLSNFTQGQPNSLTPTQDCVSIGINGTALWADDDCNDANRFVCEF